MSAGNQKRDTTKVAFSGLTAQSHITDEPELDLHLDIHMQHMRELDALVKQETQMSLLIIPCHMNLMTVLL